MNLTNYPNGSAPTANTNYQKNPQKTIFLNAKMSGWDGTGTPQPGVGNDLVYRDPWGNPYIISMDLNYDEQLRTRFIVCRQCLVPLDRIPIRFQWFGQSGHTAN